MEIVPGLPVLFLLFLVLLLESSDMERVYREKTHATSRDEKTRDEKSTEQVVVPVETLNIPWSSFLRMIVNSAHFETIQLAHASRHIR